MSVVDPADVRVLIAPGIEDEDLQNLIDREEARLEAALGTPLVGGVADKVLHPTRASDPLLLPRMPAADSVVVEESGVEAEIRVDRAVVTRASGSWSTPSVSYDFADEDDVRAVVIGLVQLALTDSPYSQESSEGHSYSRSMSLVRQRADLIATLNPHRGRPASVPM